ncbi:hypothetical protein DSO57_1037849 [Entomophthora muscae]|uniref:Uncharacterized protein n=1 Tax=Entomophthora muscae TaxID=34485 RepID=A0ACC2U7W9_9FUNG|nr:hypothetical protein DSO57_1037849 [Entomophthora muscae]
MPPEQRKRAHDPLLLGLSKLFMAYKLPPSLPSLLVCMTPILFLTRALLSPSQKLVLLGRTFWLLGLGFLAQIPFTLMTRLPSPDPRCIPNPNSNLFIYTLELALGLKHSCGDVVFSCFTLLFVSSALLWILNPCFNSPLQQSVNMVISGYALVGILAQIGSQSHYTIDCVISIYVTVVSWCLYHYALRCGFSESSSITWLVARLEPPVTNDYSPIDSNEDYLV